jgi:hypothetical protein
VAEVKQVATGLASALGAMAVAIYLLQGWHILPLIGVGALIYGVVLVASQAVRVNEMRRMLRPGRLE